MSQYYGISIQSPNVIRYGDIKDISLCTNRSQLAWFATEESALHYADEQFQIRVKQQNAETATSKLPGIAFLYMEHNVPPLQQSDIDKCIGVGGVRGSKSATFIYCPPPGFDSQIEEYSARQFLYYPGAHNMRQIIEAYDFNQEIMLPAGYKPQLVPTEKSEHPTVYVHYGSTSFEKELFEPAYTRSHDLKPESGFWASAQDANFTWDDYCKREQFRKNHPNARMEFTLEPDAKVFMVRTIDDLTFLVKHYPAPFTSGLLMYGTYVEKGLPCLAIDFEAMSKDYDGLDYSYTNLGNIMGMWDCDSVCVFNPDVMRFREIEILPVDPDIDYDEFSDAVTDEDWLNEEEW